MISPHPSPPSEGEGNRYVPPPSRGRLGGRWGYYQTGMQTRRITQAIIINEKDNVATTLKGLSAGAEVSVEFQGRLQEITLLSDIPMGHKFALKDLEEGEAIIKYGEPIGRSTARIARGEHVHVHNVVSQPRGELR
jgi:altronate dehydratase small subunit